MFVGQLKNLAKPHTFSLPCKTVLKQQQRIKDSRARQQTVKIGLEKNKAQVIL